MNLRQIPYYLLLLASGTFVLPMRLHSLLLILFLLCLVFFGKRISLRNFAHPVFFLPVALFLLLLLGVWQSEDHLSAWFYAERKLTLLAVPLAFAFFRFQNKNQFYSALRIYVISVVLACVYCLFAASFHALNTGNSDLLFYHSFSGQIGFNAIYLSAYCLFAFVLVAEYGELLLSHRKLRIAGYLILFLSLVLLSSKNVLALLVLYLFYRLITLKRFDLKTRLFGSALLAGVLLILFFSLPFIRERIKTELESSLSVVQMEQYRYDTPFSGTSLRLVLAKYSFRILNGQEAWILGVGTGDFQELLNEQYRRTGLYTGNGTPEDTGYLNYNPHNQYMEILLSMGLLGLTVFLFWIASLFIWAARSRNRVFILFLLLFCSLCVSESLLSTNKGVVWFLFFVFLFIREPGVEKEEISVKIEADQV